MNAQVRYPVAGPASVLECPVHGLIVALDDQGRVHSPCPACKSEADRAQHLVEKKTAAAA